MRTCGACWRGVSQRPSGVGSSQTGGVLSGAAGATGVVVVGALGVVGAVVVGSLPVPVPPPPGLVQGVPSTPSTIVLERIAPGLSARTVNTPGAGKLIVAVPLELVAWSPTVAPETAASLAPSVTV